MKALYRFVGEEAVEFPAWRGLIDAEGDELQPDQQFEGLPGMRHPHLEYLDEAGDWAPTIEPEPPPLPVLKPPRRSRKRA